MRPITIAVPENLWSAQIQRRRCVVPTEADADNPPSWNGAYEREDVAYTVSTFQASDTWVTASLHPPQEPPWGADMEAAAAAHAATVVWISDPENESDPPAATPDRITVIVGLDHHAAIEAMGLEAIETEESP